MDKIDRILQEYAAEHLRVFERTRAQTLGGVRRWIALATNSINQRKKIMFFGNGGSAADAQHLATELSVRFLADRAPIAALALTTDSSALTACGNDFGFEHVFARQLEALAQKGDMAVGISTSGNSKNVLLALATARKLGVATVGLTGESGGHMAEHCDLLIKVPSTITAHIQEMHIMLGQAFCLGLEIELGLSATQDTPWAA